MLKLMLGLLVHELLFASQQLQAFRRGEDTSVCWMDKFSIEKLTHILYINNSSVKEL